MSLTFWGMLTIVVISIYCTDDSGQLSTASNNFIALRTDIFSDLVGLPRNVKYFYGISKKLIQLLFFSYKPDVSSRSTIISAS